MTPERSRELVAKLMTERKLEACEYRSLLLCDARDSAILHEAAREEAVKRFGNGIFIRGLIEISNICRNDCLYCGIRKSNHDITRYRLTGEQILQCCRLGYRLGFRTFVLQGGEIPETGENERELEKTVCDIHSEFPDCAVTLSLGERSQASYTRLRKAGAERYLLRHETRNEEHYAMLHPPEMSLQNRLECLETLKSLGYQTGTGIMAGSPYQSTGDIIEDILFIQDFKPEMIGVGPFIPHKDTSFGDFWSHAGRPGGAEPGTDRYGPTLLPGRSRRQAALEITLKLISIFRLMLPDALIPATTALATLDPEGREKGILAGANVVMPNLSPPQVRMEYSLYDRKASSGAEAAEGLGMLKDRLARIGYRINGGKGGFGEKDFQENPKTGSQDYT